MKAFHCISFFLVVILRLTMATASENLFNALANHGKSKKTSKVEQSVDETILVIPSSSEDAETSSSAVSSSNDDSWNTVQSSTKRRLAPQYVLSKSDLGVDNSKTSRTPLASDVPKKKGKHTHIRLI